MSVNGGTQPRWSKKGNELFYVQDSTLMSAPVNVSEGFSAGTPKPLFQHPDLRNQAIFVPSYDVSADGRRFVLVERVGGGTSPSVSRSVRIVQNWFAEFKDRQGR